MVTLAGKVMPRSQPAVHATVLACLVLRWSYVSNSASPAADSGLKVILQPLYRQHTSLVARRASDAPNRLHKIPQRKHVQHTGAVPSRYLRRAFAVPPATFPYGSVHVFTSVARRCTSDVPVAGMVWATGKCEFNASRDGLGRNQPGFFHQLDKTCWTASLPAL